MCEKTSFPTTNSKYLSQVFRDFALIILKIVAGLQKLFEIFKNLQETLTFLDPHATIFAIKPQDPAEILKKIADFVEIARTFSANVAVLQAEVAKPQLFPAETAL